MKRFRLASLLRPAVPLLSLVALLALGLSAQAAEAKKLLVVTVTKGFRHSSIPTAIKILGELGEKSRAFTIDLAFTDEDIAAKMTAANLKTYDGFIFANTTGVLPLPDKAAFLDAIKGGKAFIGMHSASDTFHAAKETDIDPYIEMLGGEFQTHGAQAGVECLVEDREHPATKPLGEAFCIEREEIYIIKSYDQSKVHELLVLDKHPNNKKETGHFPIAWCKTYGEGRVFYTSLGHREDVWMNETYQKHILGGIKWSLGLEPGSAVPQTK
jgi:type 1 glutamine amidotransferase